MDNEEIVKKEEVQDNNMYIEQIKKMKETTVSKEQYEQLQKENQTLLDSLVSGKTTSTEVVEQSKSIKELAENVFGKDQTNLSFIDNTLKFRDQVLKETGEDIFLPKGHDVAVTEEDIRTAQRVAEGFKHCVEYANGDPNIFNDELSRITVGGIPSRR